MACTSSLSYFGGSGGRITWDWEVEATVGCDCTTAFQCQWQSETLSLKNKITSATFGVPNAGKKAIQQKVASQQNRKCYQKMN